MQNVDLRTYIEPLLKWWWLLIAAALLAGLSSVAYLSQQPPMYQSRTTLMVGSFIQDPNPSGQDIFLTQQLAETYLDIVYRQAVREATMEALGMPWLPQYSGRSQGQLLEITVTDSDPVRAQAVAIELANQLILQGPAGQAEGERQAFVEQRLEKLEMDISATEAEIERKQSEMANELSASKIRRLETDIETLSNKVAILQSTYSEMLATSLRGAANRVYIFEAASFSNTPVSKEYLTYTAMAIIFGLVLTGLGAYTMEYMDSSIRTTQQIQQQLNLPTLGAIPSLASLKGANENHLIMVENGFLPAAESYRVLRTNLQFASVDRDLDLLQITSPSPGEGKSVTAANLSVTLAQTDKRVILVDADFRRPAQHKLFNLSNNHGLTLFLLNNSGDIDDLLRETQVPNLRVVTVGPLPPNPAELLASKRMQEVLARLRSKADIVLIDTPPVTVVSDAAIVSSRVDGVLMVLRAGQTRVEHAKRALGALEQVDARVVGAVLNSVPEKNSGYFYDYQHAYGYGVGVQPVADAGTNGLPTPRRSASAVNVLFGRKSGRPQPYKANGSPSLEAPSSTTHDTAA